MTTPTKKHELSIWPIETGATVAGDGTGNIISTTNANYLVYSIDGLRQWAMQVGSITSIADTEQRPAISSDPAQSTWRAGPFTKSEVWSVITTGMSKEKIAP